MKFQSSNNTSNSGRSSNVIITYATASNTLEHGIALAATQATTAVERSSTTTHSVATATTDHNCNFPGPNTIETPVAATTIIHIADLDT